MIDAIRTLTAPAELVGFAATAVAVAGVVLNNHRSRWCFGLWLVSNAATAALHVSAGLWALTTRDVIFLALAVHGFFLWGRATPIPAEATGGSSADAAEADRTAAGAADDAPADDADGAGADGAGGIPLAELPAALHLAETPWPCPRCGRETAGVDATRFRYCLACRRLFFTPRQTKGAAEG